MLTCNRCVSHSPITGLKRDTVAVDDFVERAQAEFTSRKKNALLAIVPKAIPETLMPA